MKTGNLFQLELASASANRRRAVIRLAVTLLLALPFLVIPMPPRGRAGGLTMVILFTALLGSTVAYERLRADGLLSRLLVLPVARGMLLLDLLLAWTFVRFLGAGLMVGLYLLVQAPHVTPAVVLTVFGMLAAMLVLVNALAMGIGHAARGGGEAHLFAALGAVALATAGGLVPLPPALRAPMELLRWNPVQQFAGALSAADAAPSTAVAASAAILAGLTALWSWRIFHGR